MPTLLGLAGYLVYIVCIIALSSMVFGAAMSAFPSLEKYPLLILPLGIALSFVLKNMLWPALISEFPFTLPSSVSEMIATLFGLAGYLIYIVCMMVLSPLVFVAAISVFPSLEKYALLVLPLGIAHSFMLKNMLWPALNSEFPSTLPSSVSEMIATLLGLAGYLVYIACMMGLSFLVVIIANFVCSASLRSRPMKEWPYWICMIIYGVTSMVMDMFTKHFSVSNLMSILLFLTGYLVYMVCMMALSSLVFNAIMVPILPFLLPGALKYKNVAPMIIASITLVVNDMHDVTPVEKPAFISMPFHVSDMKATFPGYVVHMVCMVVTLYLVLIIAVGAIYKLGLWRPTRYFHPGLMLTIIVGLTLVLLNVMWRTLFEEPSSDAEMKATLLGLAGYLI